MPYPAKKYNQQRTTQSLTAGFPSMQKEFYGMARKELSHFFPCHELLMPGLLVQQIDPQSKIRIDGASSDIGW